MAVRLLRHLGPVHLLCQRAEVAVHWRVPELALQGAAVEDLPATAAQRAHRPHL